MDKQDNGSEYCNHYFHYDHSKVSLLESLKHCWSLDNWYGLLNFSLSSPSGECSCILDIFLSFFKALFMLFLFQVNSHLVLLHNYPKLRMKHIFKKKKQHSEQCREVFQATSLRRGEIIINNGDIGSQWVTKGQSNIKDSQKGPGL